MSNIDIQIPKKLLFFLQEQKRYKVAYGGRGSGKSYNIGIMLIIKMIQNPLRILCTRQLQTSIRDSVHKLLSDIIEKYGMLSYFTITRDSIRCYNGGEFLFRGIQNNINEIKSMEGVNICWVEEAQSVSQESWDILIPTIRKEGSEIWISFNPDRDEDATYTMFVKNKRDDCHSELVNYTDNPFFPDVLKREMEYCKSVDYGKYENVWLGKTVINTEAQVFHGKFELKDFETPEDARFFYGADWGFAKDPTTLVRCFIQDRCLYIDQEAYGVGVELDEIPQLFDSVPDSRKWQILADCSRPETVSHIKNKGFNIESCPKWQGSVEDGIEYIRSFERVYIHSRCPHTYYEFKFYSYKQDKNTGEVLPVLLDKDNHCLVAGTMITTNKGQIPIENIKVGDKVLTRQGYKKVLWSGVSDINRQVYKVQTDKGNYIIGTDNHRILTTRGFCDIDSIRYGDKVLIGGTQCNQTESQCMELNGTDTQTQKGEVIENIINTVIYIFTIIFGNKYMARGKKAIISIIKMVIHKITQSRIWKKLQLKNIVLNTLAVKKLKKNIEVLYKKITTSKIGIKANKVLSGIENMLKNKISEYLICQKEYVTAVEDNSNQKSITKDFALTNAKVLGEENKDLMTLLKIANGVEKNSQVINMLSKNVVVGNVVAITKEHIADKVYDLTVEDCHEFFANGILVHNCVDALRYALNSYIQKDISILEVL